MNDLSFLYICEALSSQKSQFNDEIRVTYDSNHNVRARIASLTWESPGDGFHF